MRRALLALVVAAGLAIGTVLPSSALGLTQVTLNCDDGTTWTAVVDTDTLTSLVASVQAMLDYPAGLTCTLLQTPVVRIGDIALALAPGANPFVVGGGRWEVPCSELGSNLGGAGRGGGGGIEGGVVARVPGAWYSLSDPGLRSSQMSGPPFTGPFIFVNIAVNVHQRDDGSFFGSLNETIPANQSCPDINDVPIPMGESHFSSTGPDNQICMTQPIFEAVTNFPETFVTGKVTKTSGQVDFPFVSLTDSSGQPEFVHFGFADSGTPPGQNTTTNPGTPGTTDRLNGPPVIPSDMNSGCTFTDTGGQQVPKTRPTPIFNLGTADYVKQLGNITIRNAS